MDPQYLTLGPGELTLGDIGDTGVEMNEYVTAIRVTPSVNSEDSVTVLSGRQLPGDTTFTWAMSVTCFQTVAQGHFLPWSWENKGKEVPFTFIPKDKSSAAKITGTIMVVPVELGGDVGKRNTSEVEFPIIGQPTLAAEGSTPEESITDEE